MLSLCIGIESHDEVVSVMMGGTVLLDRFWEEKSAPVRDASHYAACREDLSTSSASNSVVSVSKKG